MGIDEETQLVIGEKPLAKRDAPIVATTIEKLLRARFAAPGYAIFFEVGNSTGFDHNRRADAIAASLFPSRGLGIHGFEVKVSRSDWLRELKDPAKAESFWPMTDSWSLVCPDGVVLPGELPAGWGHYVASATALRVAVKPAERDGVIGRGFLAAILRRAHEASQLRPADYTKAVDAAYRKGVETASNDVENRVLAERRHTERAEKVIADFESASGVTVASWNGGDVGKQFRAFIAANRMDLVAQLERDAKTHEFCAQNARKLLADLADGPVRGDT